MHHSGWIFLIIISVVITFLITSAVTEPDYKKELRLCEELERSNLIAGNAEHTTCRAYIEFNEPHYEYVEYNTQAVYDENGRTNFKTNEYIRRYDKDTHRWIEYKKKGN